MLPYAIIYEILGYLCFFKVMLIVPRDTIYKKERYLGFAIPNIHFEKTVWSHRMVHCYPNGLKLYAAKQLGVSIQPILLEILQLMKPAYHRECHRGFVAALKNKKMSRMSELFILHHWETEWKAKLLKGSTASGARVLLETLEKIVKTIKY